MTPIRRRRPRLKSASTVPPRAACPNCGGGLRETRIVTQIQEDLPVVRPQVPRFDVHVGACRHYGRRVQGRHPWQTSDVARRRKCQSGAAYDCIDRLAQKESWASPTARSRRCSATGSACGCNRVASLTRCTASRARRRRAMTCCAYRCAGAQSSVLTKQWKGGGRLWWLWVFATAPTVVYAIQHGRALKKEAAAVLGGEFDGVLVCDGWALYSRFDQAAHHLPAACGPALPRDRRSASGGGLAARRPGGAAGCARRARSSRGRRDLRARRKSHVWARDDPVAGSPRRSRDLPGCQRLAAHLTTELPPSSAFSSTSHRTPRIGARSRRCRLPSSIARSRAAIGPNAACRPQEISTNVIRARDCVTSIHARPRLFAWFSSTDGFTGVGHAAVDWTR